MTPSLSFAEVLDAADHLPLEDRVALVAVLRRRLVADARARLVADVAEGQAEFLAGKLRPATVDEIMRDMLS